MCKPFSSRIKHVQTAAICADPDHALLVFVCGVNEIIGQGIRILRVAFEDADIESVIAIKSFLCSEPHEAHPVLHNAVHCGLRQSVLSADLVEFVILSRYTNHCK